MKNYEYVESGEQEVSVSLENSERNAEQEHRGFLCGLSRRILELKNQNLSEEEVRKKELDKKARKNKYFQDENGRWVHKTKKGIEEVPGFQLDAEYPEIADSFEKSVRKYRKLFVGEVGENRFNTLLKDEGYCRKYFLYTHAPLLEDVTDENWDDLIRIESTAGCGFGGLSAIVTSGSDRLGGFWKRVHDVRRVFDLVSDKLSDSGSKKGKETRDELLSGCWKNIYDFYYPSLDVDGFTDSVAFSVNKYMENSNDDIASYGYDLRCGIEGTLKHGGVEYLGDYLDFAGSFDEDETRKPNKSRLIARNYALYHGLNKNSTTAFRRLFELIEDGNSEVIGVGDDFAAVRDGRFGFEDYVVECLGSDVSPAGIDRLVRIQSEIPTLNGEKRNQNRADAIALQDGIFIYDRSFIHDEMPGVHEIIGSMVDYYDARGKDDFEEKKATLEAIVDKYHQYSLGVGKFFNLDMYDEKIRNQYDDRILERRIDVLRRLEFNTRPATDVAPETGFEDLDRALVDIDAISDEKTGKIRVSVDEVGDAVAELNKILAQHNGEVGVMPSTIAAVAYLDHMSACALRGLSKKELGEVIFDPKFKEMVRFSQMTSSLGYDKRKFDLFYNGLTTKCSKAFHEDSIDAEELRDGYRILSDKIAGNARGLASQYMRNRETERFASAVWSGNLTHELIGLFDRL